MNKLTAEVLLRGAGVLAILAGVLYIVIQLIHPTDEITSVSSNLWVIVACCTMVMSLFSFIGITGIYIRQVTESSWLGLVGFVLFSLFWLTSFAFSFMEAFILPLLTTDAPKFVEGMLGIFDGTASEVNLGVFPALAPIAGGMYILGGLLLGIATLRAKVLPLWAGVLLACASVGTIAASFIPHPLDRLLAVPMGAALIGLGYSLCSQRKRSITIGSQILNR